MLKRLFRLKVLFYVIGFVILFFIFKNIFSTGKQKSDIAVKKTSFVSSIKVKKSDFDVYEKTIGSIRNFNSIKISAETSGVVEKVNFQIGDKITQNQVIAVIDDDQLKNSKMSQEAEISRLEAEVSDNQKTLNRYKKLKKQGFLSQADLDKAEVSFVSSKKQLEGAKADLSNIKIRLGKTRVKSEISGIVQVRNINQGDYVTEGQNLFEVIDNSKIIVIVSFPEKFADVLQKGALVKFTPYGLDKTIITKIKDIQPLINENTRSVDVIIEIDNKKYNLKPGGTASVSILLEKKKGVILIPQEAVVLRLKGQVVYVVNQDNTVTEVPVKEGVTNGNDVEILSGLNEGDEVVVEGAGFLSDKALVSVNNSSANADTAAGKEGNE